ncbi:hypothetical protein, partial [Streptomyces scabiei]|uniref:hypothetical protein n=1 Tax=Streptomyces scabiei TaxID=1930 RepID=UPI001180F4F2
MARFAHRHVDGFVGWLVGGPTRGCIDRLLGGLSDRPAARSGPLIARSLDRLAGRAVDRLAGRAVDRLAGR